MRLLIGNLPPDTSDDDLREFVNKYMPVEFGSITHIDVEDENPSVLIEVCGAEHVLLAEMQRRFHHLYWKGCELSAHVMLFSE
ncbi:RNA-binding protein [Burkholderia sp. Ac-20353]|uniref:RNA recognition motif domain-containing protein n=1 Tax=Burkholderia sp. Ac-20353 TaxID=2703894 RepID=UPI00197BED2E|nr:RNA-binding protein [Burkholderia sp. Ac-20353]MBN3786674.1 RNA-binding protein [Burkholderia sp. Ac-20353]